MSKISTLVLGQKFDAGRTKSFVCQEKVELSKHSTYATLLNNILYMGFKMS